MSDPRFVVEFFLREGWWYGSDTRCKVSPRVSLDYNQFGIQARESRVSEKGDEEEEAGDGRTEPSGFAVIQLDAVHHPHVQYVYSR